MVEQGTHKPLVGSSTLPSGTFRDGLDLYFERSGRAPLHRLNPRDLEARFAQHLRGHTATTKRLGGALELVAKRQTTTLTEARAIKRRLKAKKNPGLAIFHLDDGQP